MVVFGNLVSVVIRTRDIERHFRELLESFSRQTLQPSELIIVDNYSSSPILDDLLKLLRTMKKQVFDDRIRMKIVPLTDEEFSYAHSANAGISVTESELVCITNGHCLPISKEWLESGITHFENSDVAGIAGYFLPHGYGTAWEKLAYDWGWRRRKEMTGSYNRDAFFSTVNCILRRRLWQNYPFDENMPNEVPDSDKFGGEDYDWALEMMARGYRVVVEPKFDVYHSHGEGISQLVNRYFTWRRIRRSIRALKRPRVSYTRLKAEAPFHYDL